ncbi:MAG: hypothetical protein KBE09_04165 [Candidatus Pacebacteria bacterium]|nr:hypothetical protein [Candidatus Paceibacterota bacterium]
MPRLIFTADTVVDADLVAGTARKHFGLEAGCAYWKFSKPVSLPSREHGRTKALLFSASVPTGILEYVFPACGPHVVRLLAFRGIAQVLAPKEAFLVQPQLPL